MRRWLYVTMGLLCVGLGGLGLVLPILPTTPFLLLASLAFARSDPRWHAWLLSRPRFGPMIRHWEEHRAVPRKAKWTAYIVVPTVIGITLTSGRMGFNGNLAVLVLGVIGLLVVWSLRVAETSTHEHRESRTDVCPKTKTPERNLDG